MADDLETISTGVDGFIRLLRASGKIEMTDAATKMGVSKQVLEEWAAVLEEQGLVKIDYQLTRVYVLWIAKTKEEVEEKTSKIADIKMSEVRRVESKIEALIDLGKSLDEVVNQFRQISDIFEFKMGGVKDRLEKLRELKKARDEINYRSAEVAGKFKKRVTEMKETVEKGNRKVEGAKAFVEDMRSSVKELEPALVKLRVLATDADLEMEKSVKRSRELHDELGRVDKAYGELGKMSAELEEKVKDGEMRVMGLRQDLNKEMDALVDLDAKVGQDEKRHRTDIDADITSLDKLVTDFESRIGRKAVVMSEMQTIKKERDELVAELDAHRKDLLLLDVTKGGVDTVLEQIDDIRGRVAETEKRLAEFEKRQAEISKEIVELFKANKPPEGAEE